MRKKKSEWWVHIRQGECKTPIPKAGGWQFKEKTHERGGKLPQGKKELKREKEATKGIREKLVVARD